MSATKRCQAKSPDGCGRRAASRRDAAAKAVGETLRAPLDPTE